MATRKSFILYHNYFDHLSFLTAEQLGELIRAIFLYDRDGILPVGLPPVSAMAFSFIRSDLDRDRESYLAACEAKRVYGKRGGRPKKETLSSNDEKTICFFEKPKKPDNDNDNEIEVDNEVEVEVGVGVENENAVVVDGVCVVEVGEPLALRATSVSDGTHTETKEKEIPFSCFWGTEAAESISQGATLATDSVSHEAEEDMGDIPRSYIEQRWERALLYAKKQKGSPHALIRSWWEEDRALYEANKKEVLAAKERGALKSYDLDDFFEAALQRALDDTPE